jgi:thioredoxin 1
MKMAPIGIINVTDANFEALVLKNEKPVLVDFWNEWCASCETLDPFLADLASVNNGKIVFAKLDAGNNHEYASKYAVRCMPTFIMFKNGEPTGFYPGAKRSKIEHMISKALQE